MNYVSYVLYGNDLKYTQGAIANVHLVHKFYPGWTPIFYVDDTVPAIVLHRLAEAGAVLDGETGRHFACTRARRALAMDRPDCELMLSRDADSRICPREVEAVNQWLEWGMPFHVMRDHPGHWPAIMAGMYGAEAMWVKERIGTSLEKFMAGASPPDDQPWLADMLWPFVKDDCLQNDSDLTRSFKYAVPFPSARPSDNSFVGEIFEVEEDGTEHPKWSDRALIV